ncbi:IS5/IS1182 family transposase, partial [Jeotgalibacillus proteolyticus]
IFIDGTKIEANANKFTFVWRKSVEKYSASLVEKSEKLYDELVNQQIIPEIKRESPEELSTEELVEVVEKLEETVETFTQEIEKT